jgi:hypothetical protein
LAKLLEGEHHSGRGHLDHEDEAADTKANEIDLSGIDGLMRSLAPPSSGDKPPTLARASTEPTTVFRAPQPVQAAAAPVVSPVMTEAPVSPAPIRTPSPATPIGTLSVRVATKPEDATATAGLAEGVHKSSFNPTYMRLLVCFC